MKRLSTALAAIALVLAPQSLRAQDFNQITDDGTFTAAGYQRDRNYGRSDSIQSQHKEIPRGLKVWTIDERFGDRQPAEPDTLSHLFMNTIFTTGMHGEYNTLGNVGSPRINRIFIDRQQSQSQFLFLEPYDFFTKNIGNFHFTNTLSPITNLSFNTCGNRTNGEDHLKGVFAVNAGKQLGMGLHFDYIYGRGYYSNQSTSLTNFTFYSSYLGDRYQAHLVASTNHQKVAENGGITNDDFITHPEIFNESFAEDEIPTVLAQNWNRNDHHHIYLNHRYSFGFNRKVPMTPDEIEARKFAMKAKKENEAAEAKRKARERARRNGEEFDEEEYDREQRSAGRPAEARIMGDAPQGKVDLAADSTRILVDSKEKADSLLALEKVAQEDTTWMKNEYVPVTSFIHTATFDHYRRIYEAYQTPEDYYLNEYYNAGRLTGDSIYDKTGHWQLNNTFAVALLEGFNKYAKAGLKAFATYSLRHFTLPNTDGNYTAFNEHSVLVGGQLNKTAGRLLHYNITGEVGVAGADAGDILIDADADLNFRLFSDTVQLAAKAFFHNTQPSFYQRHFQSRHFWWDNDDAFSNITHSRLEGLFSLRRTKTQLRVAIDELKNYVYLAQSYELTTSGNDLLRTNMNVEARQESSPISLITLQLQQDFRYRGLHWENILTYQKSTKDEVLPVPAFNIYTNLYLRFMIAHVLKCDLGADLRYFTKYYAPDYSPALGQYAVQDTGDNKVKTGNYPIVNLYANFHLKHARFFVMLSHVNYSDGNNYLLTPHYPLNQRLLRFGVSWNFFN